MSHNCDHIRQRALKHGEGSLEYDLWIRHSRHCPECRNELYILELLKGNARDTRAAHLSRSDMSRLLQLADEQYRGGRRSKLRFFMQMLSWGGRVALFGALLFLLYGLLPQEEDGMKARAFSAVTSKAHQIKMPPEEVPEENVVDDEYGVDEEVNENEVSPLEPSGLAQAMQGSSVAFMSLASEAPLNASTSSMVASAASTNHNGVSSFYPLAGGVSGRAVTAEEKISAQQALSAEPEMFPGWDVDDAVQGLRRRISTNHDRFVESLDTVGEPASF